MLNNKIDNKEIERLRLCESILWRLVGKGYINTFNDEQESECEHLRN
jgi:hypothetical protein